MPRLDLIIHEREHRRMLIVLLRIELVPITAVQGLAAKAHGCGEPF
ncbi:hypothetical protein KQ302_04350 [Synechococcus sp. CS-602]|nr:MULTISPECIES: hypothetical protein [Synechococcaceae]MCT4365475.1 hypothetical protein [Candidatus Regnicoccus frigidus MAG-AL1]MCT0202541.1 hypothetical protein [Synechococcus sp. CS-603]MCT0204345.1 hypothetical protein [Synechococcus sp. CS-602]MCT0247187.1 hypothetical protein [Synechococcus sp. CS-601]MCT4368178.1 hypothetical protein [Candidatus Regnicoccus frigidus MAG-AL2]